jgi:hypothetical protein
MAAGDKSKTGREQRLAEALRENLRRRKAQAREMGQGVTPARAGASGRKGEADG